MLWLFESRERQADLAGRVCVRGGSGETGVGSGKFGFDLDGDGERSEYGEKC